MKITEKIEEWKESLNRWEWPNDFGGSPLPPNAKRDMIKGAWLAVCVIGAAIRTEKKGKK